MNGFRELKGGQNGAQDVKAATGTKRESLNQEELKKLFEYDKETGNLYRLTSGVLNIETGRITRNRLLCGKGNNNLNKPSMVKIGGKPYYIHHIIWVLVYGCKPSEIISYKDGDYSNTKLSNFSVKSDRLITKASKPATRSNRTKGDYKNGGIWRRAGKLPTQEELISRFSYDKDTGKITSKKWHGGKTSKGTELGWTNPEGYVFLSVNGRKYPAARIIWCLVYGYWPENEIDHINLKRDDNRLVNLREMTRECQQRNKGVNKNSTTGVKGVSPHSQSGGYLAQITVNYENIFLKCTKDLSEAVLFRWKAEVDFDYPNAVTTSTSYIYLIENNILTKEEIDEYYRVNRGSKVRL